MKRVVCLIAVMALCVALACPAFAAEDDFVPSIPYKGAPDIVPVVDPEGNSVIGIVTEKEEIIDYVEDHCLVVTPVAEAEKSELIPEDAKEQLLDLYDKLKDGTMEIPYEKHGKDLDKKDMVIRDLFDISWLCEDHPVIVAEDGVYLELIFDLGVDEDTDIYAMSYVDGEWIPVVELTNNGDGTVTVVFEDVGPVEFSVEQKSPPAATGDQMDITLWMILMVVSAAALVVLMLPKNRKYAR